MPNITFNNLPNTTPIPNANNLIGEAEKYYELYTKSDRTQTGNVTFTSETSGNYYSTTSYSSDADVYNKGEQGMMNLLYKYVLQTYIIEASTINELLESITNVNVAVDCDCSYDSGSTKYTLTIENEPENSYYTVRFRTPNNYVANAPFMIGGTSYTPVLSGSEGTMPANTFVQDRVVTANVDKSFKNITFSSSASGVVVVAASGPTSEEDRQKLWVNSTNHTLNYWNGSSWTSIVGVWG